MKKAFKWTAVFAVMFCVSTLLSMWAGRDVSWAAFTDDSNWGVGLLFAQLLTAACWALWPTPYLSYNFTFPHTTGYSNADNIHLANNLAFSHLHENHLNDDFSNESNMFSNDDLVNIDDPSNHFHKMFDD